MQKKVSSGNRIIAIFLITILTFPYISTFANIYVEGESNPTVPEFGFEPQPIKEIIHGTTVLIVQDAYTWGMSVSGDAGACERLGISYDIVNSTTFSSKSDDELQSYKTVILAADQPSSFYSNILAVKNKLETYVASGGFLSAFLYRGWIAYTVTEQFLPGNVTLHFEYDDNVDFSPGHYLISNPNRTVSNPNSTIDGMYMASSYYFTGFPNDTTIVAWNSGQLPVVIEYLVGSGKAMAVGIPMEWFYRYELGLGGGGVNENNLRLLYNEIEYESFGAGPLPFDVWLLPDFVQTSIGGNASYTISIRNRQNVEDMFAIEIRGLNSSWYRLSKNSTTLVPGETDIADLLVSVPEDPSFAGTYKLFVDVTSLNGTRQTRVGSLEVLLAPIIYDLMPPDATICSSTEVIFHWRTSSSSTSEIYMRPSNETLYTLLTSISGLEHTVIASNLTRGVEYIWFARSTGVGGSAESDVRTLLISNGVIFTSRIFSYTIERDYSQIVRVGVRNTQSEKSSAILTAINPYTDLIAQFIGSGSIDQNITLESGATAEIDLAIHAQDARQVNYTLTAKLRTLGIENRTDYAIILITVRQPVILIEVRDISVDSETLTRTLSVINHGDLVSDLAVAPDDTLKTDILIDPIIDHARLETGQNLYFKAIPLLYEGFTTLAGNLIVTAAGTTFAVPLNFSTPPGKSVFSAAIGLYDHYNYTHVLPIDSMVLVEQILEDAVTVHIEAVYNSSMPILVFENISRDGNTFIMNVQSMTPLPSVPIIAGRYVHALIGDLSFGNYSLEVRETTLGSIFLSKNFSVIPFGLIFGNQNVTVKFTPYKGAFENGTYYISTFATVPIMPPAIFGNSSFWANSTDSVILGFNVQAGNYSISDLVFSLSSSGIGISVNPDIISYPSLQNNTSMNFLFEANFSAVQVGVHDIQCSFNYTEEGITKSHSEVLKVGIYNLTQFLEIDGNVSSTFVSPFGDLMNETLSDWYTHTVGNTTFSWPINVDWSVEYSNFTMSPPNSPWIHIAIGAAIGGIVRAGAEAIHQASETGDWHKIDWGTVAKEGVKGAISGGVVAAVGPLGLGASVALNGGLEVVMETADQAWSSISSKGKLELDFHQIAVQGLSGAVSGAVSYGSNMISARLKLQDSISKGMEYGGSWSAVGDAWREGRYWDASAEYMVRAYKYVTLKSVSTLLKDHLTKYGLVEHMFDFADTFSQSFYENTVLTGLEDLTGFHLGTITWQLSGFNSIEPFADSDGDGWINLEELKSGTNPFDPSISPGVSLTFNFAGSYCTNVRTINCPFNMPSPVKSTLSPTPNVDSAVLALRFDLRGDPSTYQPHNTHIFVNGHEIGQLINVVPEGTYVFEFDPILLNYAESGVASNTVTITAENINVGAFVRSSNMKILLHMKTIEMLVIASSQEEANEILKRKSGAIANLPDFAIYPENIGFSHTSPEEDEEIEIDAKITNIGTAGFRNVPIEFIDNSETIQTVIMPIISAYETQNASIHWKVKAGTHTIQIRVNFDQLIPETTYTNNQASKSITALFTEVHDVAITDITVSPPKVLSGGSVTVTVTATNLGNMPESFNVTAYYDSNAMGTQPVNNLAPSTSAILVFNWGTIGVPLGTYTISANASIVLGETNTANNGFIDRTMTIVKPPVVYFDYTPLSPKAGDTVTFNATLSTPNGGTIELYFWNFNDTTTINGTAIETHAFASLGTYNVTLTIGDSEGFTDTTWRIVTVISAVKHDISIISVTTNTPHEYPGRLVNITVVVKNKGEVPETFNVTTYRDSIQIGTIVVTNLNVSESITLVFSWDTSGLTPCHNWTISANAPLVGDVNPGDNELTDGDVKITILGDVNGDGIINILDLVKAAGALGARPGYSNWNPLADIYPDNHVDIFDLVMIAQHFGQRY